MSNLINYEIRDEIGSGAYGAVYCAWQPAVGRDVAVKIIRPEHASQPEFVLRFEAESQMVARLEHPHIVPVYDYWRDESGAYLIMRLLQGGSLKDKLREGNLTSDAVAHLVDDICGALAAAHEQGVIHRDLKPSNILFDELGNAYLADFGIAKNLEAEVQLTPTGAVLGTPDYIAPEQIRGETLTAAADQYSLGIVLYETLTGQVPYPDVSIATLFHKHLTEPLPPVTAIRPQLPISVETVIQKATAKDPGERFPDILSLDRALKEALGSSHLSATGERSPSLVTHALTTINLPVQPTPFIGREREVADIVQLLEAARLVTLTGPGGTGKTRLSLQVATALADSGDEKVVDGVAFVSLAPAADHTLVPGTVAQKLGVVEQPGQPLSESLGRYYSSKKALLVLDNFEHVLEATPLVSELLAAAPHLSIVCTSREALRLSGEHEYPVPPLSVPEPGQDASVADLSVYESITLFVQRAQAASPSFRLTEDNATAVAAICARLDGLPLAIELAAARVRLFGPQRLLDRLESRLGMLKGGARDLPARQRTLRNTIDWSYRLLDEDERQLFSRLAVFTGGRTLEAVEAVCNPGLSIDALDGLESLLNKSLLKREEGPGGEPRFVMLETIHEYAWELLRVSGEEQRTRNLHLEYFSNLAEEMGPDYRRKNQLFLLKYTEVELGNLRAAFNWAMESDHIESASRLISSVVYFLFYNDHYVEGYKWFKRVLPRIDEIPREERVRLMYGYGRMAWVNNDLERSIPIRQRALALSRELGDRRNEGWSLIHLAISAVNQPAEHETAIGLCEDGLAILREEDDKPGIAQALNNMGELYRASGDYRRAREYYEECMAVCLETGEIIRQSMMYANLAFVDYQEEKYEDARELMASSLRLLDKIGLKQLVISGLAGLAGSLGKLGRPKKAARLLGASDALMTGMGFDHQPSDLAEIVKYAADVRSQLEEEAFKAAFAEGQAMTLERAVAYALDD